MPRSTLRRHAFAAPFVMTLAAACTPKGGPGGGVVYGNPPAEPYQTWSVSRGGDGDGCLAWDGADMTCPEEAACNPPPPMPVACPADLDDHDSRRIVQWSPGGPCELDASAACTADCAPTPIACPSWDSGDDPDDDGDDLGTDG
jgi:hypothetical protein